MTDQEQALSDRYHQGIIEDFDQALQTASGINPAWTENGVRQFAVETLKHVLATRGAAKENQPPTV